MKPLVKQIMEITPGKEYWDGLIAYNLGRLISKITTIGDLGMAENLVFVWNEHELSMQADSELEKLYVDLTGKDPSEVFRMDGKLICKVRGENGSRVERIMVAIDIKEVCAIESDGYGVAIHLKSGKSY